MHDSKRGLLATWYYWKQEQLPTLITEGYIFSWFRVSRPKASSHPDPFPGVKTPVSTSAWSLLLINPWPKVKKAARRSASASAVVQSRKCETSWSTDHIQMMDPICLETGRRKRPPIFQRCGTRIVNYEGESVPVVVLQLYYIINWRFRERTWTVFLFKFFAPRPPFFLSLEVER